MAKLLKDQTEEAQRSRLEGCRCPLHGAEMGSSAPMLGEPPWTYVVRCWREGCDIVVGVRVYHGEQTKMEVLEGPEDVIGLGVQTQTMWDEPEGLRHLPFCMPVADSRLVLDVVSKNLRPTAMVAYGALVCLTSGPALVRRRISSIASEIGMGVKALRRDLGALESLGWIEVTHDDEGRDFIRIFQTPRARAEEVQGG